MSDEELMTALCAGTLIIMVLIILALMFIGSKNFTYRKKTDQGTTCLTVTAKKNLNRILVVAAVGSEDISFERKRIRKGQSVDFVYPASKKPAKLTVEAESGNARVVEV
jgi:hypothetical protein